MNQTLYEDVIFIIDYYYRKEFKKYEELPDEKKKKHIFKVLERVKRRIHKGEV